MIYTIKSNYTYLIEADNEDEALEKWNSEIEDELGVMNETIQTKFVDSLYVEKEKTVKCTECGEEYETEGSDLRCKNCGCHQDIR
jgi:tRNA(Ile2) C34 agmatinyltransferase TiaS